MSARLALAAALLFAPTTALAGNIAKCEAVIMDFVPDEDGGGAEIASFRDATDFMLGVYDDAAEPVLEIDGYPIRAIMCERRDLMPDEDDYKILATGLMLSLSQDFDSDQSDALSVIWIDGRFRYKWSGVEAMDTSREEALKTLLAEFTARDHGLDGAAADADADESDSRQAVEDVADDDELDVAATDTEALKTSDEADEKLLEETDAND